MRKIRILNFNANSSGQLSRFGRSFSSGIRCILLECVVKVPSQSSNSPSPKSCYEIGPFRGFFGLLSSLIIHESKNFKLFFHFLDDTNPPFVKNSLKVSQKSLYSKRRFLVVYHLKGRSLCESLFSRICP